MCSRTDRPKQLAQLSGNNVHYVTGRSAYVTAKTSVMTACLLTKKSNFGHPEYELGITSNELCPLVITCYFTRVYPKVSGLSR